ncbi:MAG: hypothetical protein M1438_07945 [Deltaproteobacteria bacterium]|nr:hypothetical protein [Deltaproteobacteria bacterium]
MFLLLKPSPLGQDLPVLGYARPRLKNPHPGKSKGKTLDFLGIAAGGDVSRIAGVAAKILATDPEWPK